jgi:hypothetical protein
MRQPKILISFRGVLIGTALVASVLSITTLLEDEYWSGGHLLSVRWPYLMLLVLLLIVACRLYSPDCR